MLRVGTTGNSVPFLKESELKEKEEMEKQQAVSTQVYFRVILKTR